MKHSIKVGVCFGVTSGIITTLGLLVGLSAGTQSQLAVIGGILTIAIADAFSDALGIHVSEESGRGEDMRSVWESTIATFFAKFIFALTFVVPVVLLPLDTAVWVSVAWGLLVLGLLTYILAREQHKPALHPVLEHVGIALLVVILTHYLGEGIAWWFGA